MSTFTRYFDKLRGLTPEADVALEVLAVAQSVTGIGGASAATAIKVLKAAFDALGEHEAGHLTHEQLLAGLAKSHEALALARAGEDAALEAKFPDAP